MTIDTLLLGLGVFAILLPSLGFPHTIDDVFIRLIGLAVGIVGIVLRRRGGMSLRSKKPTAPVNEQVTAYSTEQSHQVQ